MRWLAGLSSAAMLVACSGAPAPRPRTPETDGPATVESAESDPDTHWSSRVAAGDPVPVTDADPLWGAPDAPVTIVVFGDVTNARVGNEHEGLEALQKTYGPEKIRIAWKQLPADTDPAKRGAALGAALFDLGGGPAFFAFTGSLFTARKANPKLDLAEALVQGAEAAKLVAPFDARELEAAIAAAGPKLDADAALAKALQVRAQPTFFLNGIRLTGSVPPELWTRLVDAELAATSAAVAERDASTTYAERLGANTRAGRGLPSAETRTRNPPDETIYPAVIGRSPSRGGAEPLVTIVEFGDFEDGYSHSIQDELSKLRAFYGDKLRHVFKLAPRHERGVLAAELAALILDKKGVDAFWAAHATLYGSAHGAGRALDDALLERVAKDAGLDPTSTLTAVKAHRHAGLVDADRDLADDLKVGSLPQLFINGKRLKGVQTDGYIAAIIDAEIAAAEERVTAGTPRADLYAAIMRDAKPTRAFEAKAAPAVSKDHPTRGAAGATVTIQVFCQHPAPLCKKAWATLDELDKAFPSQLRFVWRHFVVQSTPNALPAAIAGIEVKRQKGDATFWKWSDEIFASKDRAVLERAGLDKLATKFGLDVKAFDAALDGATPAVISDDAARATELGIAAVPAIFVGDFVLAGAPSLDTLKHAVRAALAARSSPPKP